MSVKVLAIICACVINLVRGEDSLLTPCRTDDVACLTETTSQFLSKTCKGIKEYDIRAIDPMEISSTDFEAPDAGLIFRYKNLKVTGLKDQKLSGFQMDTAKQDVVLTTNADLSVEGDVTVELVKKSKSFSGTFGLKGSVAGTATYGYSFKDDENGVKHYEVGPETITCQVLGAPELTVGPELQQVISNDPDVKESRQQNQDKLQTIRKAALCHITEKAYVTVIHNLRTAAKLFPTTKFFIEV